MGGGAPVLEAPPTYGSGPAGPIGPTGGDARPPSRSGPPAGWVTAVVALSVLLVVALVALGLSRRSSDSVATAPTTTTTPRSTTTTPGSGQTSPSTPTNPGQTPSTQPGGGTPPSTTAPASTTGLPDGPAPSAAELQAVVDQLVPFVEQQRALAFTTKPALTLVADADFETRLGQALQPDDAVVTRRAALLQAMTVVANGVDLVQARTQILANETVAFYDPATKTILMRVRAITPYTSGQVAAELTRALDDQAVGIARPQYATEAKELAFTFGAVVLGDAARVRAAWVASLPSDQQSAYAALVDQVHAKSRPQGLNRAIVDLIDGPSTVGLPFVQQLWGTAPDRFGAALTTPPSSTTQVLHPDRYLSGDEPSEVSPPEAGGDVVDEGVFGEQLTALVLSDSIEPELARAAADGWTGDSYVVWKSGGAGMCVSIHYELSSSGEMQELADAYTTWARSRGGVQVDDGGGRGTELEVTSCGGASSGRSPL